MTETSKNSEPKTPEAVRKTPQKIGKYELVKQLGAGGMGAVFLANDTKTRRTVALKVLPKDKAKNETLVKRFRAEAQAAANLEHENIVRVYEADEADGYLYIALEYVDGTDVSQILRKRERLPVKRSTEIIKQVAAALQHAHQQNIVHRDIKPSNLMIRKDGMVKLTDLGLARSVDETLDASITREGTTVGTVDYMAPEQARNSRLADIRSDLYSLGCTWYQMLTGHPPFHEGSLTNKLQAHSIQPPPNPRDENPEVPESVVAIITRLMAKNPDDRYQTPQELLDDLNNAHMHRSTVSNNVFAALAVSEDESRSQMATSNLPPRATPPREKPQPKPKDEDESSGFGLDQLKYVLAACGFVVVMLGIWWIVKGLAGGLDGNAQQISIEDSQRRQAEELLGKDSPPPPTLNPPKASNSNEPTGPQPVGVNVVDSNGQTAAGPKDGQSLVVFGSPQDRSLVPEWARNVPAVDEAIKLYAPLKLTFKTVGRTSEKTGDIPTLDQALAEIPKQGVILQLLGDGPFSLTARELGDIPNLIIMAEPGRTPIVVMMAGENPPADALLRIRNARLTLLGVHLSVTANQLPSDSTKAVISLSDGDLFLRQCSITVAGKRKVDTAAIMLSGMGNQGRVPHTLIDRTLIRGDCIPLLQDRASFDTLISSSLFLPLGQPALVITGTIGGLPTTSKLADDSRHLRMLSSTVVGTTTAIRIDPGRDAAKPSPITFSIRRSLIAAAEGNTQPMISLNGWPYRDGGDPPLESLLWDAEQSRLAGWVTMVSLTGSKELKITDADEWRTSFGEKLPLPEIAIRHKPIPAPTAEGVLLSTWDAGTLIANLPGKLGSELGAPSASLVYPATDSLQIASAVTRLENFAPPALGKAVKTIEIDLSKEDPGKVISNGNWASGTRFLIKGKSSRLISAIVVRGKSLVIEFDHSAEESVRFEPAAREAGEALIDVSGGSLELRNVRCRFINRSRDPLPVSIVRVLDGSLRCDDCELVGPSLANSAFHSVIRWETTPALERSQPAGLTHRHACEVTDSFLSGMGVGIDGTFDGCQLQLQNTVIATTGPACSLGTVLPPDTATEASTIDVRNCSLASGDAIFEVRDTPGQSVVPQFYFFSRQCVFAPPLPVEDRKVPPTILSAAPAWRDGQRLFWWEQANGYSSLYKCFQRDRQESVSVQNFDTEWAQFWGPTRVRRPLTARDGVLIVDEYPELSKLVRTSLQLHNSARANTWANDGTFLGADMKPVVKQTDEKSSKPATKSNPRALGF